MDKYKIVGKLRQLFFGSMAVVMSAGGVVATNMANAFAADQSLDNNVGVAARKLQYDDTEYEPTDTVKSNSEQIISDTGFHQGDGY